MNLDEKIGKMYGLLSKIKDIEGQIKDKLKTVDTKVEYVIESMKDIRSYHRLDELWMKEAYYGGNNYNH